MLRLCACLLWLALESAVGLALKPLAKLGLFVYRVWTTNKVGEKLRRPIRRWRAKRALRSWREEHGGPPDEILETFHEEPKETPVLRGKLTYAMVGALALQALAAVVGIDIAPAELDALGVAVATLGALYGRWRATKSE